LRGKDAAATSQFVDFLYSFGGSWTDEKGNANIASAESVEAFKFYGKLLREYGPKENKGGQVLKYNKIYVIFQDMTPIMT
ncbi:MAG: hypothetical protein ABIK21_06440, partial [bacterium]